MKYIQYILTNREGKVHTFLIPCLQNETDEFNLEAWRPDQLRGNAAIRLRAALRKGFALSNWHVIEKCEHPIPKTGPAQCQDGHWLGSREHPVKTKRK